MAMMEEKDIIEKTKAEVNNIHAHTIKLAKLAREPPDINTNNTPTVESMHDTFPKDYIQKNEEGTNDISLDTKCKL